MQVPKVDEAHERSVYTDLLLAILKKFVRVSLLDMPRYQCSSQSLSKTALIAGNCVFCNAGRYRFPRILLISPRTDYLYYCEPGREGISCPDSLFGGAN
jgi:hypothetical protein